MRCGTAVPAACSCDDALAGAQDAGCGTALLPPLPSTVCPQNSPYFLVLIARPSAMAAVSVEFLVKFTRDRVSRREGDWELMVQNCR
jgi:hypothetical protein